MSSSVKNILKLSANLRNKGFNSLAEELEYKFLILKKSESSLFNVIKETGEDLINQSHPSGSVLVEDATNDLGVLETLIDQKKKMIEVSQKQPIGKLSGKQLVNLIKLAADPLLQMLNELNLTIGNPQTREAFKLYYSNVGAKRPELTREQINELKNYLQNRKTTSGKTISLILSQAQEGRVSGLLDDLRKNPLDLSRANIDPSLAKKLESAKVTPKIELATESPEIDHSKTPSVEGSGTGRSVSAPISGEGAESRERASLSGSAAEVAEVADDIKYNKLRQVISHLKRNKYRYGGAAIVGLIIAGIYMSQHESGNRLYKNLNTICSDMIDDSRINYGDIDISQGSKELSKQIAKNILEVSKGVSQYIEREMTESTFNLEILKSQGDSFKKLYDLSKDNALIGNINSVIKELEDKNSIYAKMGFGDTSNLHSRLNALKTILSTYKTVYEENAKKASEPSASEPSAAKSSEEDPRSKEINNLKEKLVQNTDAINKKYSGWDSLDAYKKAEPKNWTDEDIKIVKDVLSSIGVKIP